MIPKEIRQLLEKQRYAIVGEHSAVKLCHWTKKSLRNEGVCWKEKFYGIKSHLCCQMSPAVIWCENKCIHCWRPLELGLGDKIEGKIDSPSKIIEGCIEAQRKLLSGFFIDKNSKKRQLSKADQEKLRQALNPKQFSISLSGEPTIYPYLPNLIKELRKRKIISFLVTNGLNPEMIKRLEEENALPTQLTISVNAPNKELWEFWHNSLERKGWEIFNKSLEIIGTLKGKTRRCVRLTLVRKGKKKNITNMKTEHAKQYAKLIKKAEPDFIHVKGFMSIGHATKRLDYSHTPYHEEVLKFAEELLNHLPREYKILDQEERSHVVLIGKSREKMKIKETEI